LRKAGGFALCVVLCFAWLSGPAFAQSQTIKVEKAERNGQRLELEVLTPGGPLLTGDDFEVSVNGLPATNLFAIGSGGITRPAGAVLLLDTSGSMQGTPISEAKKAARLFLNTVDPATRVGLVGFAQDVTVFSTFSHDRKAVKRAVDGLKAQGETSLYDGLIRAVGMVRGKPFEQRNIVLLSDGADTVSDDSLATALDAATDAGATVFVVALESPEFKVGPLRSLSSQTGGKTFVRKDASELSKVFEGLAQTLVSRYEVTVTNPDAGATFLEVDVHVTGAASAQGTRTFQFPSPEAGPEGIPSVSRMPLPVLLLIVFMGVGLAAFLTSEIVRRQRTSPADRVMWYQDGDEHVDTNALINAAILDRAMEVATELAHRTGYLERLEREIDAAGMKWRPGEVIVASVLAGLASSLLGFALWGPVGALLLGVLALVAPMAYIRLNAAKRRRSFLEQLPDVLTLISGALKAGYSLQQSVAAVGEDARPPASEEFRRAMAEIRLGATLDDALRDLARRVDMVDFDWTVMAIEIQREVGGDLAEILEIIASTIRERERLRRQIRALTAEGRLSAWVLGALPFGMAGFLMLRSPKYLEPLYTTSTGIFMVVGSAVMMMIGVIWMRKIVRIEV
jgi:tight adherence protein B